MGGKAVHGCICAGPKHKERYCSFYEKWGAIEDKPWCRTRNGCGVYSLLGSYFHCDAQGAERRRANDGKLYNMKEFEAFYGKGKDSGDRWKSAKPYTERKLTND